MFLWNYRLKSSKNLCRLTQFLSPSSPKGIFLSEAAKFACPGESAARFKPAPAVCCKSPHPKTADELRSGASARSLCSSVQIRCPLQALPRRSAAKVRVQKQLKSLGLELSGRGACALQRKSGVRSKPLPRQTAANFCGLLLLEKPWSETALNGLLFTCRGEFLPGCTPGGLSWLTFCSKNCFAGRTKSACLGLSSPGPAQGKFSAFLQ